MSLISTSSAFSRGRLNYGLRVLSDGRHRRGRDSPRTPSHRASGGMTSHCQPAMDYASRFVTCD